MTTTSVQTPIDEQLFTAALGTLELFSIHVGDELGLYSHVRRPVTVSELAARVGTSQAVVQRIETGKCRHPRIIVELSEALDVSPAWLMYGATAVDGLDQDAIETARAWLRLSEPHRSAMRDMIMRFAAESSRRTAA